MPVSIDGMAFANIEMTACCVMSEEALMHTHTTPVYLCRVTLSKSTKEDFPGDDVIPFPQLNNLEATRPG